MYSHRVGFEFRTAYDRKRKIAIIRRKFYFGTEEEGKGYGWRGLCYI